MNAVSSPVVSRDPLFQPFRLKHLTFRNRLMSTAHEPAYTEDGLPKDRYRLYHREKAKGGIALTMIGGSAVIAPDSPQAFGNILLYKDESVRWMKELADDVHEHGAKVMIQVTHLGRRTSWAKADWLPIVSASNVREPAHRARPKAMEDWDFERIIRDYADAAERVKEAGLDGFELECYGHLIDQFWSPVTNRRTDEWGGVLENRLRFGKAVVAAIRERIGTEFVVGLRMVADERLAGGIDAAEGLAVTRAMVETGAVDFVNVIRGHIDREAGLAGVIPGMGAPANPHLDFAGEVRAAAGVATFHASRIQDVASARYAIESGKLDMVGMTRAHIADPHIAAKILRGEEHRIRPCVGMGYCIDSIYGGQAVCVHNAATGREATMPHEIAPTTGEKKHVVVIGGGPGGLEAARVAAARGHKVTLLEAAAELGGQVLLAGRLGRRKEILGIVDWRIAECEAAGVEVRTNTWAEAEDVLALAPDVVVVATGGLPDLDMLEEGSDLAVTSWDVLAGAVKPGAETILFDDDGGHPGMTTAEFLAGTETRLEVVTPERSLAPDIGSTAFPPYLARLSAAGTTFTLGLRLRSLRREGNRTVAVFFDEYAKREVVKTVDTVVIEAGSLPVDDLYFSLKPLSTNGGEADQTALRQGRMEAPVRNPEGRFLLFRIGDAVAGRNIHAAIYEALRLLKDI